MKRKWKIVLIIVAVLAIVVAYGAYYMYNFTQGSENLDGEQEEIPTKIASIPNIEKDSADWSSWQGANFDKKSAFTGLNTNWSDLTPLWKVSFLCQDVRTASWSAPVVQGEILIVPGRDETNDLVFCLNANTGELIWKGSYKAESQTNHGPGARATPFIDGDRVYTFGRSGDLVCWKLIDGSILWQKNVSQLGGVEPQWGHSSSPLVINDMVVVQAGGDAIALAFNKMNGELMWKAMSGTAGYAPPTIFKSGEQTQILLFHGKGLAALNLADGKTIWDLPWETSYDVNASMPISEGNIIFITSGYGTGCEAIKVENNKATPIWKHKLIEGQHTDPVIVDGYVYGYSGNSSSNSGDLVCLRLADGKEMWRTSEVGNGTFAYADGHLICFDIKGNLYLVEVNPEKCIKKGEIKKAMPDVKNYSWTAPVVANGKLYIRYLQHLICYDIAK